MIDLTTVSVMPLLISSITAATVAYVFTGYDVEFFFTQSEYFLPARIPYAVALGVLCGFVSPLLHQGHQHDGGLLQLHKERLDTCRDRRCHTRHTHFHIPASLRRGLRCNHIDDQRRCRFGAQRLLLLQRPQHGMGNFAICARPNARQGICHLVDQRGGRCGWNIRSPHCT